MFSQRWLWRVFLWYNSVVRWKSTDVAEEHFASIFEVEQYADQETRTKELLVPHCSPWRWRWNTYSKRLLTFQRTTRLCIPLAVLLGLLNETLHWLYYISHVCLYKWKRVKGTFYKFVGPINVIFISWLTSPIPFCAYTGCFTTLVHNCRRWFPRSLWSKKFI
jgi:hypothetical protein